MRALGEEALAALEPTRAALAAAAQAEGADLVARARQEADRVLAEGRARADQILAEAAAQGTHAARQAAARRSARVRREAHELVLTAQSTLQDELRRELIARIGAEVHGPRGPAWREVLAARCRADLGPGASLTPGPDGGVVGVLGSRRLDLSVPVLAEEVLRTHAQEVRALWAP